MTMMVVIATTIILFECFLKQRGSRRSLLALIVLFGPRSVRFGLLTARNEDIWTISLCIKNLLSPRALIIKISGPVLTVQNEPVNAIVIAIFSLSLSIS